MKTNQAGLDLIKSFEGLYLKPYICPAGVPTIGYGATFYEDGKKVTMKDPAITKERAEQLLSNTLKSFEIGVAAALKKTVTDNEFSALVSFAFNVGLGNLRASTLLKLLNNSAPKADIAAQFLRWNKAGGKELAGLTRRRTAEKTLFLMI